MLRCLNQRRKLEITALQVRQGVSFVSLRYLDLLSSWTLECRGIVYSIGVPFPCMQLPLLKALDSL